MRRKLRKITSVCLAVIMIWGVLTIAPISVSAANNTQETAKTISTNTYYQGSIRTYKDGIWTCYDPIYYTFRVSSPSKVSISCKHDLIDSSYSYWTMELYNTEGNVLLDFSPLGNKINSTSYNVGIPAGTYYIKVSKGYLYSDFEYAMKVNCTSQTNWETEPNNTYTDGDTIKTNTYYSGSIRMYEDGIWTCYDEDYYKFSLSKATKVNISFKHNFIDSTYSYWDIKLNDVNGNEHIDFTPIGNKTNSTSSSVNLSAGNYYIKITKGYLHSDIDYSFSVNTDSTVNPTSISVSPSSLTLNVGSSYTLAKSVTPSNATTSYTWSSSNTSVATVSNGKVTAKKAGTANITVKTSNGKTASCYVTVKSTAVAPTSVSLNKTSLTLGAGESYTLIKSVTPSNASTSYTWSSSNTSVATVSNGKITAKKAGTANITVKTSNGKTATCKLTVKSAPMSVAISPSSLTLGYGESYNISGITNSNSWSTSFSWTSSNSNVAVVTGTTANKARITAKGVGTATITIRTYNGKTATCKLTVKPAPTSVKLSTSNLTLGVGENFEISQTSNSGSYAKDFTWSSSNTKVATIAGTTANRAKITAKAVGTTTITIRTYNGKTATCKLTVKSAPTSVKLSATNITLKKGQTYTISEITNSGSYAKSFAWSSSNTSVATVAKSNANTAVITAKVKGTATITIRTYNGKTATCKVTVK